MRRLNRGWPPTTLRIRSCGRSLGVAIGLAQRLEVGDVRRKDQDLAIVSHVRRSRRRSAGGSRWRHDRVRSVLARRWTAAPVFDRNRVPPGWNDVGHGSLLRARHVPGTARAVHGGTVALIVDELMGVVNRVAGRRAFTARLQVHLRAPTPVDVELTFRAWEHRRDGRKIIIRAEGRVDDALIVEADALFIEVSGVHLDAEHPPG